MFWPCAMNVIAQPGQQSGSRVEDPWPESFLSHGHLCDLRVYEAGARAGRHAMLVGIPAKP